MIPLLQWYPLFPAALIWAQSGPGGMIQRHVVVTHLQPARLTSPGVVAEIMEA